MNESQLDAQRLCEVYAIIPAFKPHSMPYSSLNLKLTPAWSLLGPCLISAPSFLPKLTLFLATIKPELPVICLCLVYTCLLYTSSTVQSSNVPYLPSICIYILHTQWFLPLYAPHFSALVFHSLSLSSLHQRILTCLSAVFSARLLAPVLPLPRLLGTMQPPPPPLFHDPDFRILFVYSCLPFF